MDPNDPKPTRIVLTATSPDGDKLALVEYENDGCGLLQNGVPIPGMKWVPCDLPACTAALALLGKLDEAV